MSRARTALIAGAGLFALTAEPLAPRSHGGVNFPIPPDGATLRLRARLTGARDVLHESEPLDARAGMRVRWTLPDNRVVGLDRGAARAR